MGDEDTMKSLLQYHPDCDRLLEDLVAIKVDVSPIDDDVRCLWVIKYDGYEEDVSLRTCLDSLRRVLSLAPEPWDRYRAARRLGPGRWDRGLRESLADRAFVEENMSIN